MYFLQRVLFLLLLCTLFSWHVTAQGFLHARDGIIINGSNKEVILRGMGLGGWMLQEPYMLRVNGIAGTQHEIKAKIEQLTGKENTEKFYKAWLSSQCTKGDIDSLAAWGFNSVRLPMHYNLFTLPVDQEKDSLKNTWLSEGFALTDSLLKWCKANRIYLILDLHAAPGGQGNDVAISDRDDSKPSLWQSPANRQKTIALWKKLAQRYAHEQWIGGYDLINETNWGFQDAGDKNGCNEKLNAELKALLTDITEAVRSADKQHLIFIEANCWANNYNGMFPLWDHNMAVSFHKYWNYNDTAAIGKFLTIRREQHVPLWMGEAGENSNAWFTDAISLLEQNHIGWSWWPEKKLGSNNPLQIKAPAKYEDLLQYGRTGQPVITANEGIDILMQLARATRVENNIVHRDVIDAMFRQVRSRETLPFRPHRINSDLIVYASDYDLGREGIAYHDNIAATYWVSDQKRVNWNEGGQYRNDGVDIGVCTDSLSNGYSVGWTESGEWLQYTVTAARAASYHVAIRAKGGEEPSQLSITVGDSKDAEMIDIPANAAWSTYMLPAIQLSQGVNHIRLNILKGGMDISYLRISSPK